MDNQKKLNYVAQTNETNNDVITNDTTQFATMDNLENLKESANSVANYTTTIPSVTNSMLSKTSSGQIKPMLPSDESMNINASFISSDQEEKKRNEILESKNKTKLTEDEQKSDHEEYNTMSQRNLEIHHCCIPGCINNANYFNENTDSKPESIAMFTPSSIENMYEWSSVFGLHLTMKSRVCEKHFKSEDAETREVKSLKYDAVPLKIQNYGKTLRIPEVNNDNEDITIKKIKINDDKSGTFSHFGELSVYENIKIIKNDPPISSSNPSINFNNGVIDILSNIPSYSSMENNILSSLEKILPNTSANNYLSISLQPSVQQSKQVLIMDVTSAIDGLNHSKKPVEELSITPQYNSIQTNSLLNYGETVPNKLTNNGSFSLNVEKSNYLSAKISATQSTEVINPSSKINLKYFDVPQTISTDDPNKVKTSQSGFKPVFSLAQLNDLASSSSGLSIKENEQVAHDVPQTVFTNDPNKYKTLEFNFKPAFSLAQLDDSASTSFGPSIKENEQVAHDVPQFISTINPNKIKKSQYNLEHILTLTGINDFASTSSGLNIKEYDEVTHNEPRTINNYNADRIQLPSQLISFNRFNNSASTSSRQKNDENVEVSRKKMQMSITILDSAFGAPNFNDYSSDSAISDEDYSLSSTKSEPIDDVFQTSVNDSQSNFEQPGITEKEKLSFQSNFSKSILNEQKSLKSNQVKKFLKNSKRAKLPNKFWKFFYSSNQNSALFVYQKEVLNASKRIFFNNDYVPEIQVNDKTYFFKKAIKTKCDLENLLEDVDDIKICSGYYGHFHATCIGYFDNYSEEIEGCRNCQKLKKDKSIPIADEVL